MNIKLVYMKIRPSLKVLLPVLFTFFSSVIIPIIVYSEFINIYGMSGVDVRDYFEDAQRIIMITICLGVILTIVVILTYFQPTFSTSNFILSIISLFILVLYIYVWSQILLIKISFDIVTVWLNLSYLYLFFLLIPILLIFRKIYMFIISRKELKYKVYILKVIWNNKKINSKSQIKRYISKDFYIDDLSRQYLLKNLSNIMRELENSKRPLILRKKGYKLTREGQRFFKIYSNSRLKRIKEFLPVKVSNVDDLEFWVEEDFSKENI